MVTTRSSPLRHNIRAHSNPVTPVEDTGSFGSESSEAEVDDRDSNSDDDSVSRVGTGTDVGLGGEVGVAQPARLFLSSQVGPNPVIPPLLPRSTPRS